MSTNHTTNYDLCQWEATDQVLRTDFNQDNAKIDAALAAKAEAAALNSLTQTVSQKANQTTLNNLTQVVNQKADQSALNAAIAAIPKVAVGTYIGDGTQNREISLPFTPKAIYVNPVGGKTYEYDSGHQYHGGLALQGGPLKWEEYTQEDINVLEIVNNGFQVWDQNYLTYYSRTNDNGRTYYYLAIG